MKTKKYTNNYLEKWLIKLDELDQNKFEQIRKMDFEKYARIHTMIISMKKQEIFEAKIKLNNKLLVYLYKYSPNSFLDMLFKFKKYKESNEETRVIFSEIDTLTKESWDLIRKDNEEAKRWIG